MTDQELEGRLRAWYRTEVHDGETAPLALRRDVVAIPRATPRPARWLGRGRGLTLLAAAALLLVGGAVAAGSGLLRLPSQVPPLPAPSLAVVPTPSPTGPSASAVPSPPVVTARAPAWTAAGTMLHPFAGHTATRLLDGRVLVASGTASELYDPATGSWTATGSMLIPVAGGAATLLGDGRVLMVGGGNAAAELYDPATRTWIPTGSMTTSRRGFSATLLQDGRVLVAGGEKDVIDGNAAELASAELYDPATGTWTRTGSMVATRFSHTATLLPDGRVLVAGGGGLAKGATICCDPLPTAELYDPGTGTWTATGNMSTGRVNHTATPLPDGRVLVADGTADLYDPGSGTWTATGPMATTAVTSFSATLLSDGKVLVAGGWTLHLDAQQRAIAVASAELYDPANGTWTATASMAIARMGHTATLLPDGRVLVAGGSNPGGELASVELYDPATGR